MGQPGKVLLHEVMDTVTPMIVPEFEILKLCDFPDFATLAAQAGDQVRVIATHGGINIPPDWVDAVPKLGLIASAGVGDGGIDVTGTAGVMVNVALGGLVDEDALILALRDGRLGAAALDVHEVEPIPPERWRDVPNVLLTPHIGSSSGGLLNVAEALRQYLRCFLGDLALHSVPDVFAR